MSKTRSRTASDDGHLLRLLLAVALLTIAPAAASRADDETVPEDPFFEEDDGFVGREVGDPLEPVNRPIFFVNDAVDRAVLEPVARFYGWAVPEPIKTGVRGVFSNLNRPVVFVNQVLQLHPRGAAETLGRFALNSTLGFGGLFDPAAELGWDEHYADFGQTLGRYGVPPGIYHVFPLLGPSTTRDAFGAAVDTFLRIDRWILPLPTQLFIGGGYGITEREDRREEITELRRSSLDFYAAVRSGFLQHREGLVQKARRSDP
jgi:phospholipid-binding lipoprotein MlaA